MINTDLITKQTDMHFPILDPLNGKKIQAEGCYFKSLTGWAQYDIGAILSPRQELDIWISALQARDIIFTSEGFSKIEKPYNITIAAYLALWKDGVNAKTCSQVKFENCSDDPTIDPTWVPGWYKDHTFVTVCNRTSSGGTHWRLCDRDKKVIYDPYPGLELHEVLCYAYYLVGDAA